MFPSATIRSCQCQQHAQLPRLSKNPHAADLGMIGRVRALSSRFVVERDKWIYSRNQQPFLSSDFYSCSPNLLKQLPLVLMNVLLTIPRQVNCSLGLILKRSVSGDQIFDSVLWPSWSNQCGCCFQSHEKTKLIYSSLKATRNLEAWSWIASIVPLFWM